MRLNRIFCDGPLGEGREVSLPSAGAYHLARVLRMREGAPLIVFDGAGGEYHAEIAPVLTARSVVRLDEKQAAKKQDHWRGIVIGACEQCGRTRVPNVGTPMTLRNYFSSVRKEGLRLVLSPSAPGSLAGLASLPTRVELLIGPEGGLDDDELAAARAASF